MAPAGLDLEVQGTVIELIFTIFVKTPTGYQYVLTLAIHRGSTRN